VEPRGTDKWEGFFDKKRKGGALILTSEITKFFSNGLDFENSIKNPRFHLGGWHVLVAGRRYVYQADQTTIGTDIFSPVAIRLLTFPLVTIAAINGHGQSRVSVSCPR